MSAKMKGGLLLISVLSLAACGGWKASRISIVELKPTWNVWVEVFAGAPAFMPETVLQVGKAYQLVVDLSALEYHIAGITGRSAEEKLADWLKDPVTGTANIEVLALTDPTYFFASEAQGTTMLSVRTDQVARTLNSPGQGMKAPFEVLKTNPRPDFVFDRVRFLIRPKKAGRGAVALSFWKDGSVPVDELTVVYCIVTAGVQASCKNEDVAVSSLSGVALLSPSGSTKTMGDAPAAAVHFVELSSDRAVGVVRKPEWAAGTYQSWTIENLNDGLRRFLDQSFLPNFFSASSEAARLQTGTELYNLLFPQGVADEARKTLEQVVAKASGTAAKSPSVWIRLLARDTRFPYAVPMGALAVKVNGKPVFVGESLRVETPLPVMDYRPVGGCISNWVMALPAAGGQTLAELNTAREQFSEWTSMCPGANCKEDFARFRDWIGSAVQADPTALLILAHHSAAGITFDQIDTMSEQGVGIDFQKPSLAIIDACGGAGPGAYQFVQKLSARGASAIIAPVTDVDPRLAGQYMQLLAETLAKHKGEAGYRLSHAHLETVQQLTKSLGSVALTFTLLGNGNLKLCAPLRKQR